MKKWNKYYSEKNPTKLSWHMSAKYDKKVFFIQKGKNPTKLSWPMSAKSDT